MIWYLVLTYFVGSVRSMFVGLGEETVLISQQKSGLAAPTDEPTGASICLNKLLQAGG